MSSPDRFLLAGVMDMFRYLKYGLSAVLALRTGTSDSKATLWQRAVDATRSTLDAIYARLGVSFDLWCGESAYHDMLPGVVQTLLDRGIARADQGAVCVFFDQLPDAPAELRKLEEPFIVRKSDGGFNYMTTDLATVDYRLKTWSPDEILYVVDDRLYVLFSRCRSYDFLLDGLWHYVPLRAFSTSVFAFSKIDSTRFSSMPEARRILRALSFVMRSPGL